MSEDFRISCENWSLGRGEKLKKAIITNRIGTSEKYDYPPLDDVVDENRTILLVSEDPKPCEINIEFSNSNCPHAVTIICDCQNLELFVGKLREYHNTFYGELIDDFEDTRVYRFDIDLSFTNQLELIFKFIPKNNMLWIYGMMLAIKPNLKALSAAIFSPTIDFNNVQNILADSKLKLTPSAEKCKEFVKTYTQSNINPERPAIETMFKMMNGNLLGSSSEVKNNSSDTSNSNASQIDATKRHDVNDIYSHIATYVENRFDGMEKRIKLQLDEMEERQNKRLDKIIELLSKRDE